MQNNLLVYNNIYFLTEKVSLHNLTNIVLLNPLKDTISIFQKNKTLLLSIDFSYINSKNHGKIMKNIINIFKKSKRFKIQIGYTENEKIILGIFQNYNCNDFSHKNIFITIKALLIKDVQQKYEYLYDEICNYLDEQFLKNNLCQFENDKCIYMKDTNKLMGCCHHFKNKKYGIFYSNKLILCEHFDLNKKQCSTKCVACKLLTCPHLKKQGITFTINNVYLIKYFFNIFQKLVLMTTFFTTKEKIIKKIMLLRI